MYTDKDSDVIRSIHIKWSQADFVWLPLFTGHGHPLFIEYICNSDKIWRVFKVPNSCALQCQITVLKVLAGVIINNFFKRKKHKSTTGI